MKMILRVSPSKQKAWRMLEHVYGQGDYKAERNIANRVGEVRYQLASGFPTLDPQFDAQLLLANHHGKGKEARHLIFSAEELPNATPEQYQHALDGVVAAAVDFARVEAADHDFIIVPHCDRHHPHCHMVLCASSGQRCIDWGPDQLKKFQGLDFVTPATKALYQLIPGRGAGKRPPGVGRVAYDHAVTHDFHQTNERNLANKLDYELILKAINDGDIQVSRRTKAGKPLSVVLDGKVVRLSTLRKASLAASDPGPGGGEAAGAPRTVATARQNRRSSARPRPQSRANGRILAR
jgi:hypothetical protein